MRRRAPLYLAPRRYVWRNNERDKKALGPSNTLWGWTRLVVPICSSFFYHLHFVWKAWTGGWPWNCQSCCSSKKTNLQPRNLWACLVYRQCPKVNLGWCSPNELLRSGLDLLILWYPFMPPCLFHRNKRATIQFWKVWSYLVLSSHLN